MIIKGGARAKGAELAVHLLRVDTNEEVRPVDFQGVAADNVKGAITEMMGVAAGGRASKPLYHVSISPEINERLTDDQWRQAADELGKALNLEGHQRLIVLHTKEGRQHGHVCWNRVDAETLKTAHHSHNYRTHEEVARTLEREFGLNRTQGVHAEREGEKPQDKRENTAESQQSARTRWKKADAVRDINAAWNESTDGRSFRFHLIDHGYQLAKGDQRSYVVIDPCGGVHSPRRMIKGLKVADERAYLADIDTATLPTVKRAKELAAAEWPRFKAEMEERAKAEAAAKAKEQRTDDQARTDEPSKETPPRSARPIQPEPGRYDVLREAEKAATQPRPETQKPDRKEQSSPTPRPAYWRDEVRPPSNATPSPQPTRPKARPEPAFDPRQTAELAQLSAQQARIWQETSSGIVNDYREALRSLDLHHEQRLSSMTSDIDKRLDQLNGLRSRLGALFDKSEHNREIAYLVAVRQRSLAEEKARQEKVREDMQHAHEKELERAKAVHDRRAAGLQKAAEVRLKRDARGHADDRSRDPRSRDEFER